MRCPLAKTCANCGRTEERTIITIDSEGGGVFCMTLCGDCTEDHSITLPDYAWSTALRKIAQHAGHLGMDVEQMHAVMLSEEKHLPKERGTTPAQTAKRARAKKSA